MRGLKLQAEAEFLTLSLPKTGSQSFGGVQLKVIKVRFPEFRVLTGPDASARNVDTPSPCISLWVG